MTVCIAAFADSEKRIVVASDSKVAFGDFSTDNGAIKYELLGQRYLALIAGNDVVYASPTINRIKAEILRTKTRNADEIAEIVYEQLCDTRNRVIEAKVLKRYKLSVEEFVKKGKHSFTDQVYYDICSRIDRQNLSLTFLVAGFDDKDKPHLRIVSVDEPPHDYDALGYAAVGTGAPAALAALSFAKDHSAFSIHSDLEDCASHVLAAKFMSESATDVGRETFFMAFAITGVHHLYDMGGVQALRSIWLKDGAPRRSKRTIRALKDLLFSEPENFFDVAVMERCLKYVKPNHRKGIRALIELRKEHQQASALPKPSGAHMLEGQR